MSDRVHSREHTQMLDRYRATTSGLPLLVSPAGKEISEDHLTIQKWTWGLAALYGAVLLVLVLMVAAGPYTKTETANSRIEHGFSAATIADPRTDRTGSPLLVP